MNITRAETSYKVWAQYIEKFFPNSLFRFAFCRKVNIGNVPTILSLVCNDAYLHPFRAAMQDFYYNTTLPWFLRTADDVFISIDNLYKLIYDLEQLYDPKNEIVVKGHTINLTDIDFFIHGGSGWLLSRAAVKELLFNEKYLPFSMTISIADDILINKYWKRLGVTYNSSYSDKFAGNEIVQHQKNIMPKLDFKTLSTCPNQEDLIDPRNIAVWHSADNELAVILHGDRFIKAAPPEIRAYFNETRMYFCKI
ncbi:hypothetical protein TVAG_432710 [Trichomonas vaginalis G3]|uniref:N-acetylgalactosaminide beta-1,3-galactosyltransferase n=1 Tax=Trichomonas vaginalis (strain ATCC PRA-98 / G3) TaxID=412133 RepID=A2DIR2_TRIV3|nr:beta1,3-galactosyltransferase family [Trichomonas vaginalis G3]EAY19675.1 hypothetical protein TVAG_432710 [Trichomonas vaginalis G3]KAI5521305.1 beta1,3-galactosyltransferase family [Trichomonas vaginalis G3]|eukprot:XP_001580661.1 hypothetical protein [Trichomonas vaginalis G3]